MKISTVSCLQNRVILKCYTFKKVLCFPLIKKKKKKKKNNDIQNDVVYFDFSKAFDSVNHDILLTKLKHEYGINGTLLKFLVDYLQNRQQCVVIGGHQSEHMPVCCCLRSPTRFHSRAFTICYVHQ